MLELSIVIDLALGKLLAAGVISALLVGNAVTGAVQERRAKTALALLRERLVIEVRVRRDRRLQMLAASELATDDIVYLRLGDIVPADILLIDGRIQADQSQLTGESQPIDLAPGSTVHSGTFVSRGEATGRFTATGTRSFFGKTAELVRTAEAPVGWRRCWCASPPHWGGGAGARDPSIWNDDRPGHAPDRDAGLRG